MKIQFLDSISTPQASYRCGQVADLPEPEALSWIRTGQPLSLSNRNPEDRKPGPLKRLVRRLT
jgi:hypothetical protein